MSAVGSYALFAATFAASVATPGPDVMAVVGRSLGGGSRASVGLIAGIAAGKLLLLSLALCGLAAAAAALGPLFVAVKFIGAAYLVWLGIKLWRRPIAGLEEPSGTVFTRVSLRREIGIGLAMAIGNPVAVMFSVAVLPTVFDLKSVSFADYGILCAVVAVLAAAILACYAAFAGSLRRIFRTPSARRTMDRTAGTAMIGAGLAIAAR